jgi:anthranilate/para-aminobenzoate synthase component I
MNLCNELEGIERGLYSGALGWIDGETCDFSVVIRTLIMRGTKFEFQAGGGITSGSIPENELAEMYTKCKPIMELLNCHYPNLQSKL